MYDRRSHESTVDILLATYNGEKYLPAQIDSILGQTYENWRLLINDDGSNDTTRTIIEAYVEQDNRIHSVELENKLHSAAGNFLALLKASTAPYAMFCDQDDVWEPYKIAVEMEAMQQLEFEHGFDVPLLVFADSVVVDEQLDTLYPSFVSTLSFDPTTISLSRLLVENIAQGCTMLLNRELIETINQVQLPESIGIHDHWAMLIAAALGAFSYIPQPVLKYRQHIGNAIGATTEPATARKGVSRFLHNPKIIVHWLEELSADKTTFIQRAADMKNTWGDSVSPDALEVLTDLSTFKGKNRINRLRLIKRYRLISSKDRKNLYTRSCRLLGMLT